MERTGVVVVGAGPAGVAAAIQLARSRVDTVLLEKSRIGGLLLNANLVENYPGFPDGITGPDLVDLFERQLAEAGIEPVMGEAVSMKRSGEGVVTRTKGIGIRSRAALIASGTVPKRIEGIDIRGRAAGRIYYEVFPLLECSGKRVAVIGAGDAAFDYALNMSRRNKVVILNRGDTVRCLPLLWERCVVSERISYRSGVTVLEISGARRGVTLRCRSAFGEDSIGADYVLAALGREPCVDFLGMGILDPGGLCAGDGPFFMAGDVGNGSFRQAAISVGDGIRAAMMITDYILRDAE